MKHRARMVALLVAAVLGAGALFWDSRQGIPSGPFAENAPPPLGIDVHQFQQFLPVVQPAYATTGPAAPKPDYDIVKDVAYGPYGYRNLLDLYLPRQRLKPTPIVVWIHGGGWIHDSKEGEAGFPPPLLEPILLKGFAVASINYRMAWRDPRLPNPHGDVPAIFPAQIMDVKSAVRFLRSHAQTWGLDPTFIGVVGHSSGGHLASLMGASNDFPDFDHDGWNRQVSSDVQAAIPMSAVEDFQTYFEQLRLHLHALNYPPADVFKAANRPTEDVNRLLGGLASANAARAAAASPVSYISSKSPPFLIIQGFRDTIVPPYQAEYMHCLLVEKGVTSTLLLIPGALHAGPTLFNGAVGERIASFIQNCYQLQGAGR